MDEHWNRGTNVVAGVIIPRNLCRQAAETQWMNETRLGASSKWPRMNEGGLGVEWMNDGKDEGRKHWWSVSGLLGLLCLAGARRPAGWRAHRTSTKDDGWVVIATRCDGCVVGWAVDTDLYTRAAISYPDVFRFSSQAGFGQTFAASLSALLNPLLNLGHRGIASGGTFRGGPAWFLESIANNSVVSVVGSWVCDGAGKGSDDWGQSLENLVNGDVCE